MKKLILTLTFLIFASLVSAQWNPDVRLTNNPSVSETSRNNTWCIAANGDFVHVIWFDQRDGNREIYYKRSTNGGISWGTDKRLTNDNDWSTFPSVSVSGSFVHVVWTDYRNGNDEIYYKRSTNGGTSWEADTRLTYNTAASNFPSVSVSGSTVHVVWQDERDDSDCDIYYKRSTDGGTNWGADIRLTNNPGYSKYPSISVSNSTVHVAWFDDRDYYSEIYYKRSTDGGTNWGVDTRLTNDPAWSHSPSISALGPVVHVVWEEHRDGNYEIYDKRSMDGGISWGADTRLTNNSATSWTPSVTVSSSLPAVNVHVIWRDERHGNTGEIYYKHSTDEGTSWGADTRLKDNSAESNYPSISVSGSVVHVVWYDKRDGNYEIYYKRNPTGNPFPPSQAPNLLSPPNNSMGQSLTPLLDWDNVSSASTFRAQLSTDSLFGTTAFDTTVSVTQVTVPYGKLANNVKYYWRVRASNVFGYGPWSVVWNFTTALSGITQSNELPKEFSLSQNIPNPFNPETKIRFDIPKSSYVKLMVYDILGREIKTLVNENVNAGRYEVSWDGSNYPSGVYFYRLEAGEFVETRRMVMIK